jgi:hypothetical protein
MKKSTGCPRSSSKQQQHPAVIMRFPRGLGVRDGDNNTNTPDAPQQQQQIIPQSPCCCASPTATTTIGSVDNMVPDKRRGAIMLNVCGELRGMLFTRRPSHRAWKRTVTRFGVELQSYTSAGNISLQCQRVIFKGATDPAALRRAANTLFSDSVSEHLGPVLQLIVLQTAVGRSLYVHVGCLLERNVEETVPWLAVCSRCEEVCNVVPMSITRWDLATAALGLPQMDAAPETSTLCVTRRGVMTLRLTWATECPPWTDNEPFLVATEKIARFLYALM